MKKWGATRPIADFICVLCIFVAGCAVGPDYVRPQVNLPEKWYAPLPHGGDTDRLSNWWRQFDDPLVAVLIETAQADSPTLEQALARIRQSRNEVIVAQSAMQPAASLSGRNLKGGGGTAGAFEQKLTRGAYDASWEIDLFGGARRSRESAQARQQSAEALWHDARLSLAAEVALEYAGLRTCEAQLAEAEVEQTSLRQTEKLTLARVDAGFAALPDASLARAATAAGASRVLARRVECETALKALVALTGMGEPALRALLQEGNGKLPMPAVLYIDELPARKIGQRPDVVAAERALASTSAEIGVAEAARYPRIALLGQIGRQNQIVSGISAAGGFWSFAPTLDVPVFDAGQRKAQVEIARARYDEALAVYKGVVRRAVREVEQSLVRLASAAAREKETSTAAQHYEKTFRTAEQRWSAGIFSLLELEETRRMASVARSQHITGRYESIAAWIALYRSVGDGWETDAEKVPRKENGLKEQAAKDAEKSQDAQ